MPKRSQWRVSTVSPWYIGSECDGGFADYVTVAARHAYPIDSSLSDAELASFPCSYSTAENMLTRAQVTENDTLLITGASGGVGSAAIQLAKARGAQCYRCGERCKSSSRCWTQAPIEPLIRGVIACMRRHLGDNAVDVVIDLVGGEDWPELLTIFCDHLAGMRSLAQSPAPLSSST